MGNKLRINVEIDQDSDKELYDVLISTNPRRRAANFRNLALMGLKSDFNFLYETHAGNEKKESKSKNIALKKQKELGKIEDDTQKQTDELPDRQKIHEPDNTEMPDDNNIKSEIPVTDTGDNNDYSDKENMLMEAAFF